MKDFLRKHIPGFLKNFSLVIYLPLKRKRIKKTFRTMYLRDMLRYLMYSRTFESNDPTRLISSIILHYHVIEKGLTMPEPKPGFGHDRVIALVAQCEEYISRYGQNEKQLNHAIAVLLEYENFNESISFALSGEVKCALESLKKKLNTNIQASNQPVINRKEYFANSSNEFDKFSWSRSSVRSFSEEEVSLDKIMNSLELARNAPSACNRQSSRAYVYTNRQIIYKLLERQGGSRGFGHLANKLIIISGELGAFCYASERNQVFIDGGIFVMNLLYSLHYNKIASCVLNCSFDYENEEDVKKLAGIKDSEVLIAMIACGYPPDNFKIASSPRNDTDKYIAVIN